jgi:hypothetical protein
LRVALEFLAGGLALFEFFETAKLYRVMFATLTDVITKLLQIHF